MKYVLIILAFSLVSCGQDDHAAKTQHQIMVETEVDPRLEEAYAFYKGWVEYRGIEEKYPVHSIKISTEINEMGLGGICDNFNKDGDRTVRVMDLEYGFFGDKELQFKYILMHEMMHCAFNMFHVEGNKMMSKGGYYQINETEFLAAMQDLESIID